MRNLWPAMALVPLFGASLAAGQTLQLDDPALDRVTAGIGGCGEESCYVPLPEIVNTLPFPSAIFYAPLPDWATPVIDIGGEDVLPTRPVYWNFAPIVCPVLCSPVQIPLFGS